MCIRFKRLIAFIVDWNVTLFPFVCLFSFLTSLLQQNEVNPLMTLFVFLIGFSAFGAFILRDFIFKGRSLGKRIFGLYIYKKDSLQEASKKQLILRNIFLFLYVIDGILLLATGETIGDRVAGTFVSSKHDHKPYEQDASVYQQNPHIPSAPQAQAKNTEQLSISE